MNGQDAQLSRSTFRNAAGDVAWQKQLRDRYVDDGAPPVDLNIKRAIIRPVSRKLAEQIILKYEWLGTMGAGSNYFYGIFFESYCAGVVCFGVGSGGANVNAHMEFRIRRDELAYLARGANVHWSPKGANSKLVSWACRLLPKRTNAKLAIAYSDTDAGEIGTIYQACNWVCIGKGSSTTQWIAPNGRIYDQKHPSNLRAREGNKFPRSLYTNRLRADGWKEQKSNPKYRYVCVIDKSDKALIDRIEHMRQPYPKRNMLPVNGDNLATSQVGQFDSDPEALMPPGKAAHDAS